MERPRLLPTEARHETHAGVIYHLDGEGAPMRTIESPPGEEIHFEHPVRQSMSIHLPEAH